MTAKIAFLIVAAGLSIFQPHPASSEKTTASAFAALNNTAEISADRLQVDHEQKTAVFEGHVRAAFGKLRVTCAKMSLRYNDKGEVDQLKAWGNVTVITEDAEASAGSAQLDSKRGILILAGSPSITKGPHRLEGSRIEVELNSGRVDVADAKGTFRLQQGAAH